MYSYLYEYRYLERMISVLEHFKFISKINQCYRKRPGVVEKCFIPVSRNMKQILVSCFERMVYILGFTLIKVSSSHRPFSEQY